MGLGLKDNVTAFPSISCYMCLKRTTGFRSTQSHFRTTAQLLPTYHATCVGRDKFGFTSTQSVLQMGLAVQDGDEASPRTKRVAKAESSKALRKLDWERRWLAAQMKWDFSPEERLELFAEFGVSPEGKERKLQLVRKLWAPHTIR